MSSSDSNLQKFLIPLEEIKRATNDFSHEIKIGEVSTYVIYPGSKYYRGTLSDRWKNRTAFIKRLARHSAITDKEFYNEINFASRFNHENIISFIGYCHEGDEMILVTEYAINGSLEDYLLDPDKLLSLTWPQRLKICIGAAKGLYYLHSGLGEGYNVIHGNFKSKSVWLDENLEAKLCSFYFSKEVGMYQKDSLQVGMVNSLYVDPIYMESCFVRPEADAYSFGVVLFELLIGMLANHRKAIGDGKPLNLKNLVRRYYKDGLDTLIDPSIKDQIDRRSFLTVREIAYKCISLNLNDRPSMDRIVKRIREALDIHVSQMFGFCRYNGIDKMENLIDSLNMVWIGKLRLHVNIARFDRNKGFSPNQTFTKKHEPDVKKHEHAASTSVKRGVYNSQPFVNVVKGVSNGEKMDSECTPVDDSPTVIVSQDDDNELELALIGCHKDFRSIANSKTICRNEGFTGVEVKYLGGLWVMFVFNDKQVKDSFLKHEGIVSWFSSLEPWHDDFVLKERLVWLEIEGVPIRSWNNDTFKSICKKWGKVLFIDDTDSSNRFSIRLCIKSTHTSLIFASTLVTLNGVTYAFRGERICRWTLTFAPEVAENEEEGSVDKSSNAKSNNDEEDKVESVGEFFDNNGNETHFNKDEENMVAKDIVHQPTNSDPFELESLIAKNGNYQKQGSSIPKFPPGFTQSDGSDIKRDLSDVCKPVAREDRDETSVHYESKSIQPEDEVTKKHVGVSMIQQVEDTIKVSTALGFNMEGCQDMLAKMITDMGDKVETKMLHVDLWTLRQVWGNSQFDFVSTSARGRSGGILYIWNKLLFHKERIISVDSYVAVQGTWLQNGLKIMFVVVYAPQDLASKIILWSTLSQLISNWDGNAIIMGNFNEVQEVGDRFGT
ncbi:reverse transcriptase domain, reverse transcriptase zinc-binding domain protein, partial [Tanacetum coccineum]